VREALAEHVQGTADQNGAEVAQQDDGQQLREDLPGVHAEDFSIADRQRNGAFTQPATHDRDDHEEQHLTQLQPAQHADGNACNQRKDRAQQQGQEDFGKAFHDQVAVHREDAADHDR